MLHTSAWTTIITSVLTLIASVHIYHIKTTAQTFSSTMKFSSISKYALFVAFIPDASSFVPNAVRFPACSTSTTPLSFTDVISVSQVARSSSELNLFGSRWRKTRQINSQSKVGKAPITESEVRGLFELWNSALATGDSRIVASRYTKVCLDYCMKHS